MPTMVPPPPAIRAGTAYLRVRNAPLRFRSRSRSHICSDVSWTGAPCHVPAFRTTMSRRPHFSSVCRTARSTCPESVTSAGTASAPAPVAARSETARLSSGPARPEQATAAPPATSAWAVVRPRPRLGRVRSGVLAEPRLEASLHVVERNGLPVPQLAQQTSGARLGTVVEVLMRQHMPAGIDALDPVLPSFFVVQHPASLGSDEGERERRVARTPEGAEGARQRGAGERIREGTR